MLYDTAMYDIILISKRNVVYSANYSGPTGPQGVQGSPGFPWMSGFTFVPCGLPYFPNYVSIDVVIGVTGPIGPGIK
jgi:hypothetical protein